MENGGLGDLARNSMGRIHALRGSGFANFGWSFVSCRVEFLFGLEAKFDPRRPCSGWRLDV